MAPSLSFARRIIVLCALLLAFTSTPYSLGVDAQFARIITDNDLQNIASADVADAVLPLILGPNASSFALIGPAALVFGAANVIVGATSNQVGSVAVSGPLAAGAQVVNVASPSYVNATMQSAQFVATAGNLACGGYGQLAPTIVSLSGMTLTPTGNVTQAYTTGSGFVYCAMAVGMGASTILTIDFNGVTASTDPRPQVVVVGSTLNVGASTEFKLLNGALASDIVFAFSGAINIGASATVVGTFATAGSVTTGANVNLVGRILAAVALTTGAGNTIIQPASAGSAAAAVALPLVLGATAVHYALLSNGPIMFAATNRIVFAPTGSNIANLYASGAPGGATGMALGGQSMAGAGPLPSDKSAQLSTMNPSPFADIASISNSAAYLPCLQANLLGFTLNGKTLTPGPNAWCGDALTLSASNVLTIDFAGVTDTTASRPQVVIKAPSLSFGASSVVKLLNGAVADDVIFIISGLVSSGASAQLAGLIIAQGAVQLGASVQLNGRMFSSTSIIAGASLKVTQSGFAGFVLSLPLAITSTAFNHSTLLAGAALTIGAGVSLVSGSYGIATDPTFAAAFADAAVLFSQGQQLACPLPGTLFTNSASKTSPLTGLTLLDGMTFYPGLAGSVTGLQYCGTALALTAGQSITFDYSAISPSASPRPQILIRGSTLAVGATCHMNLLGGAVANDVVWIVDGAVVVGASSTVVGTFALGGAATLSASIQLNGRVMAAAAISVGASAMFHAMAVVNAPNYKSVPIIAPHLHAPSVFPVNMDTYADATAYTILSGSVITVGASATINGVYAAPTITSRPTGGASTSWTSLSVTVPGVKAARALSEYAQSFVCSNKLPLAALDGHSFSSGEHGAVFCGGKLTLAANSLLNMNITQGGQIIIVGDSLTIGAHSNITALYPAGKSSMTSLAASNIIWVIREAASVGASSHVAGTFIATTVTIGASAQVTGHTYGFTTVSVGASAVYKSLV